MDAFDVFLSHAKEDKGIVNRVEKILCAIHINAYIYERYPPHGLPLAETIRTIIHNCQYFVVFQTPNGITSQWVNQEIGIAYAFEKLIIPILQTGEKSKGLVEFIGHIEYNPDLPEEMIYQLITTLRTYLGKAGIIESNIKCKCNKWFSIQIPTCEDITNIIEIEDKLEYECSECGKKTKVSPLTLERLPDELTI